MRTRLAQQRLRQNRLLSAAFEGFESRLLLTSVPLLVPDVGPVGTYDYTTRQWILATPIVVPGYVGSGSVNYPVATVTPYVPSTQLPISTPTLNGGASGTTTSADLSTLPLVSTHFSALVFPAVTPPLPVSTSTALTVSAAAVERGTTVDAAIAVTAVDGSVVNGTVAIHATRPGRPDVIIGKTDVVNGSADFTLTTPLQDDYHLYAVFTDTAATDAGSQSATVELRVTAPDCHVPRVEARTVSGRCVHV